MSPEILPFYLARPRIFRAMALRYERIAQDCSGMKRSKLRFGARRVRVVVSGINGIQTANLEGSGP
jgi:hypothetical protein